MAKTNMYIKVVDDHGIGKALSTSIVIDYLRNYTSEWGTLATSVIIDNANNSLDREDELASAIEVFNKKIGYVIPERTLNSLMDDVIDVLKKEDPEYLTIFNSFNDIEKVAIYFILKTNTRSPSDVFDLLINNFEDLSKTDILVKLLSEGDLDENINANLVDPLNGLFKTITQMKTHQPLNDDDYKFKFNKGNLTFEDYSFNMHSYNTTKRAAPMLNNDLNNETVRNYFSRYKDTWLFQMSSSKKYVQSGLSTRSEPIEDALYNTLETSSLESGSKTHRDILNWAKSSKTYSSDHKNLFNVVGDNFFGVEGSSPLLMNDSNTDPNLTKNLRRSNLSIGNADHTDRFLTFKTLLSYYMSDLNIWFNGTSSSPKYKYVKGDSGMLPNSNGNNINIENKGYFSNVQFLEESIKKVFFPFISKNINKDSNYTKTMMYKDLNRIDSGVFDTIFDSIVNNSYVYTDSTIKNPGFEFEDNYEINPSRITLNDLKGNSKNSFERLINYKSTNLYEYLMNSLIHNKDNTAKSKDRNLNRSILTGSTIEKYSKKKGMFIGDVKHYNVFNDTDNKTIEYGDKIIFDQNLGDSGAWVDGLKIKGYDNDSIGYSFGSGSDTIYTYNGNEFEKTITKLFELNLNGSDNGTFNKKERFFSVKAGAPKGSAILSRINDNITAVDREVLMDLFDLSDYEIKGFTTSNMIYNERRLLDKYINEYKMHNNLSYVTSNYNVVVSLLKDLDSNKSNNYWPKDLQSSHKNDIRDFLNRSLIKIDRKRDSSINSTSIKQVEKLIEQSSVRIPYTEKSTGSDYGEVNITLDSISTYLLQTFRTLISYIKIDPKYVDALEDFNEKYKGSGWLEISASLERLKNVLIDDELIYPILEDEDLYVGEEYDLIRNMDIGLYKLGIINFFAYLSAANVEPNSNFNNMLFKDNYKSGIVKFYDDLYNTSVWANKYHKWLPIFIDYIITNKLPKYTNIINAVKTLPVWDYEILQRRDKEELLKLNSGVNKKEYKFYKTTDKNNIFMVNNNYGDGGINKRNTASRFSKERTIDLYRGGLGDISGKYRDLWFRRFIPEDVDISKIKNQDIASKVEKWNSYYSSIRSFEIPTKITIEDNNTDVAGIDSNWNINSPDKVTSFRKALKKNSGTYYQDGSVATFNFGKLVVFTSSTRQEHYPVLVPILLMGDDDFNKSNGSTSKHWSFELDWLNMWYTDQGFKSTIYDWNEGIGGAHTWENELVTASDKYKGFGLGRFDIQEIFNHYWKTEPSVMGNPYTVMYFDVFDKWSEGYGPLYDDETYPWSTVAEELKKNKTAGIVVGVLLGGVVGFFVGRAIANSDIKTRSNSNKYDFKYVMRETPPGSWSPIKISNENKDAGVDPDVTASDIYRNIRFSESMNMYNRTSKKRGVYDIMNRGFRNRILISYLRWKELINSK